MEQFESKIYQEYDDVLPPDTLHDVKRRLEELSYTTEDSFLEEINVEKQRITKLKEQGTSNGKRRLPTWNELESKLEEYEKLNYDLQLRVQCMMEYLHKTRPERVKQLLFESFKWEQDRKVLEEDLAKAQRELEEFKGTPTQKQLIRNLTQEIDSLRADLDIFKDQIVQQEHEKDHLSKKYESEIQFLRQTIENMESQAQKAHARIEDEVAQKIHVQEELNSLRNHYHSELKQRNTSTAQRQEINATSIKEENLERLSSTPQIVSVEINPNLNEPTSLSEEKSVDAYQIHTDKIQKRNELLETIFHLVENIGKNKDDKKSMTKVDINSDFETFATALAEKMYELIDQKTLYHHHLTQIKEECFLGIKLFLKAVEERLKGIYTADKLFTSAGELKSKWLSLISLVQKDIEKVKRSFTQLEQVHDTKQNAAPSLKCQESTENTKSTAQDCQTEDKVITHKELHRAINRIHELESILDKKGSSSKSELLAMKKKIAHLNETIKYLEKKCQASEVSHNRDKDLLRLETQSSPLETTVKSLGKPSSDHQNVAPDIPSKNEAFSPYQFEHEKTKSQALERQLNASMREISRLKHKIKQRDIILRKITTQLELVNERKEDVEKVILRQVKNDLDIALGHGHKDSTDPC